MKSETMSPLAQQAAMNVARQTHLVAGIFVWTGLTLALTLNLNWLIFVALPGIGLLLDATTGVCPMTLLLKRMPWNRE